MFILQVLFDLWDWGVLCNLCAINSIVIDSLNFLFARAVWGLGDGHKQTWVESRFALKMHQKTLKITKRRKISGLVNLPDRYIISLSALAGRFEILRFSLLKSLGILAGTPQHCKPSVAHWMIARWWGFSFWQSPAPPTYFLFWQYRPRINKHPGVIASALGLWFNHDFPGMQNP